jgi:hypothetical protein
MNDFVAALERGAAEDAQRVMAKLSAAGPSRDGLFIRKDSMAVPRVH